MSSKISNPEPKPLKPVAIKPAQAKDTARLFLDIDEVNRRSQKIVPRARYVE
jgi:hypothetical protein